MRLRSHRSRGPGRRAQAAGAPARLERFDYVPTQRSPQLLGLSLLLEQGVPGAHLALVVERCGGEEVFQPQRLAAKRSIGGHAPELQLRLRAVFAVPSQLACDPLACFSVRLADHGRLELPAPGDRRGPEVRHRTRAAARAAVLVLALQLVLAPSLSTVGALADGPADAGGEPTVASSPPAETLGEPSGGGAEAPEGESGTGSPETPAPEALAPEAPATPTPEESEPRAPVRGPAPSPKAGSSKPAAPQSAVGAAQPQASAVQAAPGAATVVARSAAESGKQARSPAPPQGMRTARKNRDGGGAPASRVPGARAGGPRAHAHAPGPGGSAIAPATVPGVLGGAFSLGGLPPALTAVQSDAPPAFLIPIYKQAGRRYGVPWRVLAAINQIETDYGRNVSISSAGAEGWMQFMPETWQRWGLDADHDGHANPYSPQDAIFAAARYLRASGAATDLAGAIYAYNHAGWYVTAVLLRARMLDDRASFAHVVAGYSLPLDAAYMSQLGRTDDGVDLETPPDGALVYSITPGVISAVASDPAGFGPSYPVVEAGSGALAGQHLYYGHVAESLVSPGQRVAAGQPIAVVGHTGDAASLGHGHIEIGFSDASGVPLTQHGSEAWTPTGAVMRSFLVELSNSFGVSNE